ncbi:hypothetical protein M501DRAFT_1000158 [Patellaria atrata CBS 101060]|uniref:DUF4939 domain-containing protein n=1 Tax=Patellaria atrata CBS 101060 TaxID=1346257 RepID=A0A9P4S318_9PEZI|nr:hypothetical protein M501DRAFT_1000158 [Patellaria atrata CBS 101060]
MSSAAANTKTDKEHIQALYKRISELENEGTRTAKVKEPAPYDGKRDELRGFLTQVRIYHKRIGLTDDSERVLDASAYLKGDALEWFEPIARDYLENSEEHQEDETVEIFKSFPKFEETLKNVFREVDEQ